MIPVENIGFPPSEKLLTLRLQISVIHATAKRIFRVKHLRDLEFTNIPFISDVMPEWLYRASRFQDLLELDSRLRTAGMTTLERTVCLHFLCP